MLTKKQTSILLWITISLCILVIIAGVLVICLNKQNDDDYTSKYQLESSNVIIQEKNNASNSVNFDSNFETNNTCIYFNKKTNTAKRIDDLIDTFFEFENIFLEKGINIFPQLIYISNSVVFNSWEDENGSFILTIPENGYKEEILAWLLYFSFKRTKGDDSKTAPFGLYAGIASYWLNLQKYKAFIPSSIENAGCLTDLQFPLYEKDNLTEKEKTYAWSFSTYLVESLFSHGKNEKDVLTMDKDILNEWLEEYLNISLPNYSFEPYSTKYEYKVKQEWFTYYINKQYKDLILPTDLFSTKYSDLADWLKDNWESTKESNEIFNLRKMYDIDVFLDDGLKSTGITGYAYGDYINVYSVGSFSHEYIHHILFYLGQSGYAREVIPEMHANTSKYAMSMWYYLFTGQAKSYPYNIESNEKDMYEKTLDLYKKYSAETPTVENFNFWLFADCFSAIYTQKGTAFIHRVQTDSLAYYIARVYGKNYVWQINMSTQIVKDGKPYLDIVDEWYNYIKSIEQ